jgi:benzylsuccinate CoA-transferase BbsF subunit
MPDKSVLKNIRILDFSWVLAGPYATRLLADFGAEVIKVQPMLPEATDAYTQAYYNTWNRNKLGISLDLNQPEGIEIAKELVKVSDAVVENFSPRVMTNWGLDYAGLKKLKPHIIMVSLSTMGHEGPWRDYVGFGPTAQAFSGITHLTAYPGQPPSGIGYSHADHIAALYASLAFLGALEHRRQTGRGQYIDLSETEAMVSLLSTAIINYTRDGKESRPVGNSSDKAAPHGIYPCLEQDRWCAIAVTTEKEWERFKHSLGNPAWTDDTRFATLADRIKNRGALDNLVQGWTKGHTAEEVMAILQGKGVPAGVVQNAANLARDPQLQSRSFFVQIPESPDTGAQVEKRNPVGGSSLADASPIRMSDTPAEYRRAAPAPGNDNVYVLRELLGLRQSEISRLREKKVI